MYNTFFSNENRNSSLLDGKKKPIKPPCSKSIINNSLLSLSNTSIGKVDKPTQLLNILLKYLKILL